MTEQTATATTDVTNASASLASLLEQARSTDADYAMTNESPLSFERHGKYVEILFSTGGPHVEILVEYADADDAEYGEGAPRGGWLTYMGWGTREDLRFSGDDAAAIMLAVQRSPEDLDEDADA